MNTTTRTEAPISDMTVGNAVTFPTEYGGTHSGVIVGFEERGPLAGPDALAIILRTEGGKTYTVRADGRAMGWVNAIEADRVIEAQNTHADVVHVARDLLGLDPHAVDALAGFDPAMAYAALSGIAAAKRAQAPYGDDRNRLESLMLKLDAEAARRA